MNSVLAVVVTYNRKELLNECLEALSSSKCDILVIDNHSTDGTREFIDGYISKIKKNTNDCVQKLIYFDTGSNLGGAGGYNKGLKEACKYDYKYFWLMDDDCIVNDESLNYLLDADKKLDSKWSFLSSKVLWKDNSICKTNVQRKKVAKRITDFTTDLVNVDYASFVSLLIKKEDVLKVGLPIKDFYIWTDDLEYTRRLTFNGKINEKFFIGKKGYLVNDSIVIHKCKDNIGVDITKDAPDRLKRYEYIYRNDVYTFKREGIYGWIFLITRYIYHLFKIIFLSNNKIEKIRIMTKGYINGINFNPLIEFV